MAKKLLNIKTISVSAVFIFLIAVNIYSYTHGYEEKVILYKPKASNQTMYMPEFMKDGMYPDALIRAIVKDKKVTVRSEFNPYVNYPSHGHDHTEDVGDNIFFSADYYRDNNYGLFFKKNAKEFGTNDTLPSSAEVKAVITEDVAGKFFSFAGYTNDMLRNTFMVNEDREYVNTYFHYSYYYYYAEGNEEPYVMKAYIAREDIQDAKELVAIWDSQETLYLMSRDFYDKNIAELFE